MTTAAMKEVVILREIALNCETEKVRMCINSLISYLYIISIISYIFNSGAPKARRAAGNGAPLASWEIKGNP